jgi:exodeoxyribonuclease V alpha subunit
LQTISLNKDMPDLIQLEYLPEQQDVDIEPYQIN